MFSMPSGFEMMVVLALGLLIFGRRLPEVGRSLGRTIVEFKKGMRGVDDEPALPGSAPPAVLSSPAPPQRQSESAN